MIMVESETIGLISARDRSQSAPSTLLLRFPTFLGIHDLNCGKSSGSNLIWLGDLCIFDCSIFFEKLYVIFSLFFMWQFISHGFLGRMPVCVVVFS